jgi:hypothetical protein
VLTPVPVVVEAAVNAETEVYLSPLTVVVALFACSNKDTVE